MILENDVESKGWSRRRRCFLFLFCINAEDSRFWFCVCTTVVRFLGCNFFSLDSRGRGFFFFDVCDAACGLVRSRGVAGGSKT